MLQNHGSLMNCPLMPLLEGKMTMKRYLTVFVLAAEAALLVGNPLQAAQITFTDTNPNDTVTITASDFLTFTGDGTFSEIDGGLAFSGLFASTGTGFNVSFYLVEANDPTVVSDILVLTTTVSDGGTATAAGTFFSDNENNLGPVPAPGQNIFIVSESGPVTFTNSDIGLSVTIDSDVEQVTVPEPASLWLFGVSVAGIFGYEWRRRK
jgi:hypothetical protein